MDGIHEAIHRRHPEPDRGARLAMIMASRHSLTPADASRRHLGANRLLRFWAALLISASVGAAVLQVLGPPRPRHAPPVADRAAPIRLPVERAAIADRPAPPELAATLTTLAPKVRTLPEASAPMPPRADTPADPVPARAEPKSPPVEPVAAEGAGTGSSTATLPAAPPAPPPAPPAAPRLVPARPTPSAMRAPRPVGAARSPTGFAVSGEIAPIGLKCRNMLGRAQLGEELSDADRAILRAGCKERR